MYLNTYYILVMRYGKELTHSK